MKLRLLHLIALTIFALLTPFSAIAALGPGDRLMDLEAKMRMTLSSPSAAQQYKVLFHEWESLIGEFKNHPEKIDSEIASAENQLQENLTGRLGDAQFAQLLSKLNRLKELQPEKMKVVESKTEPVAPPAAISTEPLWRQKTRKWDEPLKRFIGTYTFGNGGFATMISNGWGLTFYSSTARGDFQILIDDIGKTTTERYIQNILEGTKTTQIELNENVLTKTQTFTVHRWRQVKVSKAVKSGNVLTITNEIREFRKNLFTRKWSEVKNSHLFEVNEFFETSDTAMTLPEFQKAMESLPVAYRYTGKGPLSADNLREAIKAGLFEPVYEKTCEPKLTTAEPENTH